MAKLEVFKWCTQIQGGGGSLTSTDTTREVVFGNGYTQVASSGFNTFRRDYQNVYGGRDYKEVIAFLKAHVIKPFAWVTPQGDMGLFRVKSGSIGSKPLSSTVQEVSATFTEQFSSMT